MAAALGWYEMLTVLLGWRLGCYDRLAEGSCTAEELAVKAAIAPRYAAEWLEQQAAAGLVSLVEPGERETRRYDLVCAFETLHDMGDPVAALSACRSLVAEDGVVLVADMAAADEFTAPADDLQRFLYAFSVLHCLPVGLADSPTRAASAATGTLLRPQALRELAAAAGFGNVDPIEIPHDKWRFWVLRP